MKKKLIIALLILVLLVASAIFYLNKVVLPVKIKSLIIQNLQNLTQKKVSIQGIKFNIFKGLVLSELAVYDEAGIYFSIKQASCTFFILPIIQKRIIIPTINFESPIVFLERRPDHTLNLADLFPVLQNREAKTRFNLFIYKVSIKNCRIDFQDDTFSPIFTQRIDGLDLSFSLALPPRIKFNLRSGISGSPGMKIKASGEFKLAEKQLYSKITIEDFSPREFAPYYRNLGILIPQGAIAARIKLTFQDNILDAQLQAQNRDLALSRGNLLAKLDADISVSIRYNFKAKQLSYAGQLDIMQSEISGIAYLENIAAIKGELKFNNQGFSSDRLTAQIFNTPVEAKFSLINFNEPLLNISFTSNLALNNLWTIMKDKFQLNFLEDIQGEARLSAAIETALPLIGLPKIQGSLDIAKAMLKIDKIDPAFLDINGRIDFTQEQIQWSDLNFQYQDIAYKTNGTLSGLRPPVIACNLSSEQLFLESTIAIKEKSVTLSKLNGRYLNSAFSFEAFIDLENFPELNADIAGGLDIDLQDIKRHLKKFQAQLEQLNPGGLVHVKLDIDGNIQDIKSCTIQATLTSPSVSFYGLKGSDFFLNYEQAEGLSDISLARLSFYDGTLEATAKMNLNSEHLPYWIGATLQGLKLEKLKLDTALKAKEISGTLQGELKLNGFSGALSKLNGAGQVSITEGNLWQLDLFKGIGALIFAQDFANIVFHEASCGFIIKDKYISSDSLTMHSQLVNLSGPCKIGFDGSLDAAIDIEIMSELVPLSGTLKDIATAIIGKAGRLGVIRITGTLKEPRHKFQPAVVDIIQSLKDTVMGNILR